MTHRQGFWKAVTVLGILLFLVHSLIFVLFGQINADEGWYLYASKLVYTGARPYEDFAYTQMPLLPYIYGIAQNLLTQSLYLGRITSVIFSAAAFGLAIIVAHRYGGIIAAGITALLWATFTYGLYFQSITKTQALVTFFFYAVRLSINHKHKTQSEIYPSDGGCTPRYLDQIIGSVFCAPLSRLCLVHSQYQNQINYPDTLCFGFGVDADIDVA